MFAEKVSIWGFQCGFLLVGSCGSSSAGFLMMGFPLQVSCVGKVSCLGFWKVLTVFPMRVSWQGFLLQGCLAGLSGDRFLVGGFWKRWVMFQVKVSSGGV